MKKSKLATHKPARVGPAMLLQQLSDSQEERLATVDGDNQGSKLTFKKDTFTARSSILTFASSMPGNGGWMAKSNWSTAQSETDVGRHSHKVSISIAPGCSVTN